MRLLYRFACGPFMKLELDEIPGAILLCWMEVVVPMPTTFHTQYDWLHADREPLLATELEADLEAEYVFWATPVPQ
jgi:hypothetical protein